MNNDSKIAIGLGCIGIVLPIGLVVGWIGFLIWAIYRLVIHFTS